MKKEMQHTNSLHQAIKKRYGTLVTASKSAGCGNDSSCCTATGTMEGALLESAGYSDDELAALPRHAVEHSYGCGNPLAFTGVKPGQTVLDIGSGAGIDCFIASEKVGPQGRVIGIDMTPEMLEKARQNAKAGGFHNVEFREGQAEEMPVDDLCVDWVISNCVINLSPDKTKVFKEIARILKPGGRFAISDIVLGDDLPESITQSIYAWTGCIAGAIRESDYLKGLKQAGLTEVYVDSRINYDEATIRSFIQGYDMPESTNIDELVSQITDKIWSAKLIGIK